MREAVRILEETGIENIKLGIILFDPFMSYDELVEGMEFINNAQITEHIDFSFARITFYETSPLARKARSQGILKGERTESLAFRANDFLDQRVGRLSRIFDAWRQENKPLIFGVQQMRCESEASSDVQNRAAGILRKLRRQYYHLLNDMVHAYKGEDREALEKVVLDHLAIRADYCNDLIELLPGDAGDQVCGNVYKSAVELRHTDLLTSRIMKDSAGGKYLDWACTGICWIAIRALLRRTKIIYLKRH